MLNDGTKLNKSDSNESHNLNTKILKLTVKVCQNVVRVQLKQWLVCPSLTVVRLHWKLRVEGPPFSEKTYCLNKYFVGLVPNQQILKRGTIVSLPEWFCGNIGVVQFWR